MHELMLICESQTFTLTESFTEGIFWGLYRVETSLQTCKIPSFTFTEQWLVHCIKEFEDCAGGKMHTFWLLCKKQRFTLTQSLTERIFWGLYRVEASLQICKTPSFTSPGQWFWHCIKEFVDRHWEKMHQLMVICQCQTFTLTESFTERIFWGLYRVEANLQTCKIPIFTFTEQWLVHCIKEFEDCAGGKMHPFWLLCKMQRFTLTESFIERIVWVLCWAGASVKTCKNPSFTSKNSDFCIVLKNLLIVMKEKCTDLGYFATSKDLH